MRWTILLILSLSVAFAADEIPSAIKPALDSFEGDAAKAYLAYQQAVSKAADKATKDMETKLKAAIKSGNLDVANAIKAKMTELAKGDTLAALEAKWKEEMNADPSDLLKGPVDTLVGKWGDGNTVMWEFKADGTGNHFWGGAIYLFKWVKTDAGYTVTLQGRAPRKLIFVDKNTINVEPGNSIRMK